MSTACYETGLPYAYRRNCRGRNGSAILADVPYDLVWSGIGAGAGGYRVGLRRRAPTTTAWPPGLSPWTSTLNALSSNRTLAPPVEGDSSLVVAGKRSELLVKPLDLQGGSRALPIVVRPLGLACRRSAAPVDGQ